MIEINGCKMLTALEIDEINKTAKPLTEAEQMIHDRVMKELTEDK